MRTPPEMTCGFLIQLVFCKKKTVWFIRVEVEQETPSAPPPKKNPGSAPDLYGKNLEQEKYRHMIKEFNDFSNEVGYDIISYCNNEITLVTRRIDPDSQTIVISDDFVREKSKKTC